MNFHQTAYAVESINPGVVAGIEIALEALHPEHKLLSYEESIERAARKELPLLRRALQELQPDEDAFFERLRSEAREKCLMKGIFVH